MFDHTLVVWGGDFEPIALNQLGVGRDHHLHNFTIALAGGGIWGSVSYGLTDQYGDNATENRVYVRFACHVVTLSGAGSPTLHRNSSRM